MDIEYCDHGNIKDFSPRQTRDYYVKTAAKLCHNMTRAVARSVLATAEQSFRRV